MSEIKKHAHLSSENLEKIKADLIKRKEQILKDLKSLGANGEDSKLTFPEYGDKSDENAQEISEYTTNLAADQVLEKTLRDIDSALKRIENNTYGICKYCNEEIPEKRLIARPVASACVACKTKLQNS